jgi:hypothetical protein
MTMTTPAENAIASELLGEQHPLVGTLELYETFVRQSAVVTAVLVGGAVGIAWHLAWSSSVASAAAAVQIALGVGLAIVVQSKRSHARDLIAEGREHLPLRCVAAERERLLDPSKRRRLALLIDRAVDAAENWERIAVTSRPPQAIRRIRPMAYELRALAAELRTNDMSVRAVALTAQMLAGGYASPFYTGRLDELRTELTRIRHFG